jgi:SAM-dependent methyltransferase
MANLKERIKKAPYIKDIVRWRKIAKDHDAATAADTTRLRCYQDEFEHFKKTANTTNRFNLDWAERMICDDRSSYTPFDAHYIYHTAWAARLVGQIMPQIHIDISSLLYFSTLVSAFVPVEFYDYRPAGVKLPNLATGKADLLGLPFANDSVLSLSCMHTVEHVGLGRYGDSLDYDADLKAMNELKRVLIPGGHLLFVVPVGKAKIIFNAHRIYSYQQILEAFSPLKLVEFSLIGDDAYQEGMKINATEADADAQKYGCGCFYFTK